MKIFIGADHRGFELKEKLKKELVGFEVIDCGNAVLESNDDYPDFGIAVGKSVVEKGGMGIVICGSGVGISIAANKISGVRCALCWREEIARQAREHLDANVIAIPSDFLSIEEALRLVKIFLETKFSNEERHKRRIEKINNQITQ
jgi:ribose 5-phosphate isomerase B